MGIFDNPSPNAFATGWNKNNALVAVSTGLLRSMNQDEVEAVLAHEVSHVSNGDMITLSLVQGVVNTFVVFLSRVVGHVLDRVILKNERGHGPGFWISSMVTQAPTPAPMSSVGGDGPCHSKFEAVGVRNRCP